MLWANKLASRLSRDNIHFAVLELGFKYDMGSKSTHPLRSLEIRQSSSLNRPRKQNQYYFQSGPFASAQPARQCCLQRALLFRTEAAGVVSEGNLEGSRHSERLELGLGILYSPRAISNSALQSNSAVLELQRHFWLLYCLF